jgi:hypothetical protein
MEVETPYGKATLETLYLTELGHVMAKVYYPEKQTWMRYKLDEIENLLQNVNVKASSKPYKKKGGKKTMKLV